MNNKGTLLENNPGLLNNKRTLLQDLTLFAEKVPVFMTNYSHTGNKIFPRWE